MPSTPRGSNAATLLAVVVAIVLAFAWLRSSDGAAPAVPAGLSVPTVPAAIPEEPATPDGAVLPTEGHEGERAGGHRAVRKPRKAARDEQRERAGRAAERGRAGRTRKGAHAHRAGGREDARARRKAGARQGGRDRVRQDPPATAPAPSAGSDAGGSGASGGGANPPEFALE